MKGDAMQLKLKLRVGDLMKERGISEGDMWKRSGVARNSVRALMRGHVTRLDVKSIERIADVLEVQPTELFENIEGVPGQYEAELLAA
jgi:DNA-binding Xre family transcriptional regulator